MKKLIVTAHPSSQGFTHTITEKLTTLSEAKGDNVEILDLYKTDLRQEYLRYESVEAYKEWAKTDPTAIAMRAKITLADEIILVFPTWWGDMPAIMKNWMDSNFTAGFAFQFVDGKPVGLLKGKTARIITTSGAPSFFYKLILHVQLLWNWNRIGYCGIKQKSFTVFGNMDSKKTDRTKYLAQLEKLV